MDTLTAQIILLTTFWAASIFVAYYVGRQRGFEEGKAFWKDVSNCLKEEVVRCYRKIDMLMVALAKEGNQWKPLPFGFSPEDN